MSDDLWTELCRRERAYFAARMNFMRQSSDRLRTLQAALRIPQERGTALRLMPALQEEERRRLLPDLVDLASVGHADVMAVRKVIGTLDRRWLRAELPRHIDRVLGSHATDEEFRRLAELLVETDRRLLGNLVHRARAHVSADVREVGEDFADLVETSVDSD